MKKLSTVLIVLAALAAGVTAAILGGGSPEPEFASFYPQPRQLQDFTLKNQHGQRFTQEDLQNKWTLAFVGYTFCPDICPSTLAELNRIYPELKQAEGEHPVQILFMSVDPKRDNVARLNEYIQFFNPEFIAASAKHKVLFPLVRSMGMMYAIEDSTETENYLVGHSGAVVIINPQGQVIGRFKPQMAPGEVAVINGDHMLADMPLIMN